MANEHNKKTPSTSDSNQVLDENIEKWGPLKHKCGYEKCDFKGKDRNELYEHLELVHNIKRARKLFKERP